LHCDGFNLVQNNELAAGQTVFHFHIHLIPRYKDDHQKINWVAHEPADEELDAILEELT
jgi:histidine triad (HIT) family protein